ncbi:hypothetical protein C8F04DRAFT_1193675 [Mycena alexandri]|uniref:Uncharacterized protein n=1 Tax=Mycena alexandri TaxID=1745969 RepID=A0AAD6SBF7_9AGAR|nr:hypothetical protein C8F04DRAFT_1193675 [Mycena alexandri]
MPRSKNVRTTHRATFRSVRRKSLRERAALLGLTVGESPPTIFPAAALSIVTLAASRGSGQQRRLGVRTGIAVFGSWGLTTRPKLTPAEIAAADAAWDAAVARDASPIWGTWTAASWAAWTGNTLSSWDPLVANAMPGDWPAVEHVDSP